MKPVHLALCRHYAVEARRVLGDPAFEGVTASFYDGLCERAPLGWKDLERAVAQAPPGAAVRVVGGPCLSRIDAGPRPGDGVEVHRFDPCFHLVAPLEQVARLLARRRFLTSPGWLLDWRAVFEAWGLDRETARAMYQESSTHIHLLDTGVLDDAEARLAEMAAYLDLPWEITPAGLEHFRLHLERIVIHTRLEAAREEAAAAVRRVADLEAMVDALGMIAQAVAEDEAVERLRRLATALFGSRTVCYLPVVHGEPGPCHPPRCGRCEELRRRLETFLNGESPTLEVEGGFVLRLQHRGETLGAMVVQDLVTEQYRDRYAVQARSMADAFGLAIAHARAVEAMQREREEIESRIAASVASGELPTMCAGCKKVREENRWVAVDGWLLRHTGLAFSHGLCPECREKYFPRPARRR